MHKQPIDTKPRQYSVWHVLSLDTQIVQCKQSHIAHEYINLHGRIRFGWIRKCKESPLISSRLSARLHARNNSRTDEPVLLNCILQNAYNIYSMHFNSIILSIHGTNEWALDIYKWSLYRSYMFRYQYRVPHQDLKLTKINRLQN
jgi:hypothetical protein